MCVYVFMQSLLLASADGDVESVKQVLGKWDHSKHNINETDAVRSFLDS